MAKSYRAEVVGQGLQSVERQIRASESYRQYQWNNGRQDALLGRGSAAGVLTKTGDQGIDDYQDGWRDGINTLRKLNLGTRD
jgi:hypothetical protein